jgi:hypothetical protein
MAAPVSHSAEIASRLLAQGGGGGGTGQVDVGATLLWSAVIILLIAVLFWSLMWLRKHLKGGSDDSSAVSPAGFTLADIRQLYKDGKMSTEEYERAKAKVLESAKAAAEVRSAQESSTPKDFYREI